jgi:hypothetical protein
MESMNPALALLLAVRRSLERGQSVKIGILDYLKSNSCHFSREVTMWYGVHQQNLPTNEILSRQISSYRQTLLHTLERGLRGEPIYNYLLTLEEEIIAACETSLAESLGQLPFVLLIPLLLFQLPAFLALLFGPLLRQFFEALGSN